MENAVIRACQIQARRVMQAILMFETYQELKPRKAMSELDLVPEITEEFIADLYAVVWIGIKWNGFLWYDFYGNHFKRMTKSPYLFANYIAYASYVLIEKFTDAYACFVDIVSLVLHFSYYCSITANEKFKNTCLELICAIFDKELCIKFIEQGHWKGFHKYFYNEETFKNQMELLKETETERNVYPKLASLHEKSTKPYVINGVVLKDINRFKVENHMRSVSIADSVKDKLKKVCKKSFEDLLQGFQETEIQAEGLFREIAGGAFSTMVGCEEQFSLQEIQGESSENFCTSMTPENIENKTKQDKDSNHFENKNIDSVKAQDFIPDSDLIPKLENIKKAKALLREMMEDIANISELFKFVCEENETVIPYKL